MAKTPSLKASSRVVPMSFTCLRGSVDHRHVLRACPGPFGGGTAYQYGLAIDEPFVINLADAPAIGAPGGATFVKLEPDGVTWPDTGVNVQVMRPGEPAGCYHSEPVQEDFLVLYGECVAIVEDEESDPAAVGLPPLPGRNCPRLRRSGGRAVRRVHDRLTARERIALPSQRPGREIRRVGGAGDRRSDGGLRGLA